MPEQDYFDTLYHYNDDPWGYTQRWYEQRKRQICLALLPRQRYGRILELGCANGVLVKSWPAAVTNCLVWMQTAKQSSWPGSA